MPNLSDIEAQVAALEPDDLAKFKEWFEEFQEDLWDKQIEADSLAGRLDFMSERALRAHAEGRSTPITGSLSEAAAAYFNQQT